MKIRYLTVSLLSLLSHNDAYATGTPVPPEAGDPTAPPPALQLVRSPEALWHLHWRPTASIPEAPTPPNTPIVSSSPPGGAPPKDE